MATDCNYDLNRINNIGDDISAAFNYGYLHGIADAKPKWIPVTERLPEIKEHYASDTVLVYLDDGGMSFSKLEENIFGQVWFDIERPSPDGESDYTVTHWLPLPQPPESEGEP